MMGLEAPVALIAHDAGAANHIIAWLENNPGSEVRAFMAGPAETLWKQKCPNQDLSPSIESAINTARSVLTGSGWASTVEHDGRIAARALGLNCVAVIDHWTNYAVRFERDGQVVLPDEIWVADMWAARIASVTFPDLKVVEQENVYLAREIAEINRHPQATGILFVGEPARDDWGKGIPGEFQALEYFLRSIAALDLPADVPIRLRPHPSEPNGKYDNAIAKFPSLVLDQSDSLAQALAASKWVAGMQSYALTVALAAGKTVFSALPPWAPDCVLPQEGIVYLRDLQKRSLSDEPA